jgi:hypothetical protein
MSKFQVQIKFKFQSSIGRYFDIYAFGIDLKFACLPVGRDFGI